MKIWGCLIPDGQKEHYSEWRVGHGCPWNKVVAQWQNNFTTETIVHVLVEGNVIAGDGDNDAYKDLNDYC